MPSQDLKTHTLHAHQQHCGWEHAIAPQLTIAPSDTVSVEIMDASGGQFNPESTVADLLAFDFSRTNPTTGPIYVDRAEPGDVLKVSINQFEPSGWGWTGIFPGFGLLADQFTEAALHLWHYQMSSVPTAAGLGRQIPLKPFVGTIGLAPAEPGLHSVVPPRRVAGNMDIRDLSAGSVLYLPVEVAGAIAFELLI